MKIILAGTPKFSVRVFENIINAFDVLAIISQPDKPKNRGKKIVATPVKELGKKYNIKVLQPNKIIEIEKDIKLLDCDILITCAYGQIIPQVILDIPKKGALNIHASLLPKYRGASPIHYAVLNGDNKTGITLMYMIKKMDAGDIIFQAETPILEKYNTGMVSEILSVMAADYIVTWLNKFEKKFFKATKQIESQVVLSPKIQKADCKITQEHTTYEAQRMIKAYNPFPGAFIIKNNLKYKIADYGDKGIAFKTKDGTLFITQIQAPNKKMLDYKEFLKGNKF